MKGVRGTDISVLILNELLSVTVKFVQENSSLMRRTVLEDTLKYTTSVRMSRETMNFADTSIRDEMKMFGRNSFECTLKQRKRNASESLCLVKTE